MSSSLEINKTIFRRFIDEALNAGKLSVIDELFSLDFVEHQLLPIPDSGREIVKNLIVWLHTAFPDLPYEIVNIIAEDDKVMVHTAFRSSQKGEFMGISPTGKQIASEVIDIVRISRGKII